MVGLAALGHTTVRLLLLPQLEPYLVRLQPALEMRKEGLRQYEATRVYGALLAAAGVAMYDKLVGTAADGLLPLHLIRAGRCVCLYSLKIWGREGVINELELGRGICLKWVR